MVLEVATVAGLVMALALAVGWLVGQLGRLEAAWVAAWVLAVVMAGAGLEEGAAAGLQVVDLVLACTASTTGSGRCRCCRGCSCPRCCWRRPPGGTARSRRHTAATGCTPAPLQHMGSTCGSATQGFVAMVT